MGGPGQTSPPRCQERHCRPPPAPAPRHPAAWHACSRASAEGGSGLGWGCGGGCPPPRHALQLLRRGLVPNQWVHGGAGAAPDHPQCAWASPRGCPQLRVAPESTGRAAGGGLRGSRWSIPLRRHGSRGISPADRCHIATETWSLFPGNRCLVLLPRPSSPAWNFPCRCAPVRNIWKNLQSHPGPGGAWGAGPSPWVVVGGTTGGVSGQHRTPSLLALRDRLAGAACTNPAVRAAEDSAKREMVELSQQLWRRG